MEKVVEVPEGVNVKVEGGKIVISGPLGSLERPYEEHLLDIVVEDGKVIVRSKDERRKTKAYTGTMAAHIKNIVTGVTKGFTYKLKVIFRHFPINISVKGDLVVIKNFAGEKSDRYAKILPGVKVEVKGQEIFVKGIDIEKVGQTAANIEQATKLRGRDPRKFYDGIYISERMVGM